MSETVQPRAAVRSKVDRKRRISLIWLIPLITLAIAGWLIWHTYSQRGPTVKVTFLAGEGLVATQSHVRHLDVDMGTVKSIELAPDFTHVIVTLDMKPEAEKLLTDKARLWVVRPRLFAGSISGLDTLVSGSYVELLPSAEPGTRQLSFTGLEDPPVIQTQQAGRTFLLRSKELGSMSQGSPVFFRSLQVGEVTGWDVAPDANSVTVHAFVRAPYDKFVSDQTRFWNASGLSVELAASGVHVQVESLKALVLGGVAFETPAGAPVAAPSEEQASFPLFASHEDATNAGFVRHVQFLSYFPGSVSGLGVGSPVTFQGMRVGQVTEVGLEYDNATDTIRAPVRYFVEPERISNIKVATARGPLENTRILVSKGLRAELQSANLITGQMRVALEIDPGAPPAELGMEGDTLVMPAVAGGFAGIEAAANQLLTKLSAMPFEQIGKGLNTTLAGVSGIVNGPELASTLNSLHSTIGNADKMVKRLDAGLAPALAQLPAIATDLEASLSKTSKLVAAVGTTYGQDSKFSRDADNLMLQLNDTSRAFRALADLLTRHPEALVRGRTNQGPE